MFNCCVYTMWMCLWGISLKNYRMHSTVQLFLDNLAWGILPSKQVRTEVCWCRNFDCFFFVRLNVNFVVFFLFRVKFSLFFYFELQTVCIVFISCVYLLLFLNYLLTLLGFSLRNSFVSLVMAIRVCSRVKRFLENWF